MKNEVNKENSNRVAATSEEPRLIQIYVHNDDFTPMEFVVGILERFFYLTRRKAIEITMEAHLQGRALCGIYSKDLAESKVSQIANYAEGNEYPLICSMEAA